MSLFTVKTKNINKEVTKCLYFSVTILYNKVIRKDGRFPFAEAVSVNTDRKNTEELNTSASERPDISYGGCRYRLSYDRYENPCRKKRTAIKPSSVLLTIGIVAVFVAVGFFILRYYNRSVKDFYEKSPSDDVVAANFQSFLPPDTGD